MRLIHYIAEEPGQIWEAMVWTSEDDADPLDFVASDDSSRPGFEVSFDGDIDVPVSFLVPDGDLMVKA